MSNTEMNVCEMTDPLGQNTTTYEAAGNGKSVLKNFIPINTIRSKRSIWKLFQSFCATKKYILEKDTSKEEIAKILRDWAINMRKSNGEDYKEATVKTIWNITAKIVQENYYYKHKRSFSPFFDMEFKDARDAKNAKRMQLKCKPDKRKQSAITLTFEYYNLMIDSCDENSPAGLQMKFFLLVSFELAWRTLEGVDCRTHYFKEEFCDNGTPRGRILYNPEFPGTCQDNDKDYECCKLLISNVENSNRCPVRLYKKLIEKRGNHIKTDRFFLTPNPYWNNRPDSFWFKDSPVGRNEISQWIRKSAENIGLDSKRLKITNLSSVDLL